MDRDGNIYTGGTTTLSNFPVTADAWQSTQRGNGDGYILVFSQELTRLIYGTYMGGIGTDEVRMTWVGPNGAFYAFGNTDSANFPVSNAWQTNRGKRTSHREADAGPRPFPGRAEESENRPISRTARFAAQRAESTLSSASYLLRPSSDHGLLGVEIPAEPMLVRQVSDCSCSR